MVETGFEVMLSFPEIEEVKEYLENSNGWTRQRVEERLSEVQFLMSRLSIRDNQWLSLVSRTCKNSVLRWSCKLLECAYKFSGNLLNLRRYYELCARLFGGDQEKFQTCEFMLMCYLVTQAIKYNISMTSSKDALGVKNWTLQVLRRSYLKVSLGSTPFLERFVPKGSDKNAPLFVTLLPKVDVKRLSRLIKATVKSNKVSLSPSRDLFLNLNSQELCSFTYLTRFLNLLLDNFRCDNLTNFLCYTRLHESLCWVRKG